MSLKIIGAGLGRTATTSLRVALGELLNKPCYHMSEVFEQPEHIDIWNNAILGNMPDWQQFYRNYSATVDWPSAAFWKELLNEYPDALVLLSVRDSNEWWDSASQTIFNVENIPNSDKEKKSMIQNMFNFKFTPEYKEREKAIAAFEQHNQNVIDSVPSEKLLIWDISQGWEPICNALNIAVPNIPFPKVNTRQQWQERMNNKNLKDVNNLIQSNTKIELEFAEKYAKRLCKHFNHKVDAEYNNGVGNVDFKFALCEMYPSENQLEILCRAENIDNLNRAKYVIEDHLKRFVQNQEISISWQS